MSRPPADPGAEADAPLATPPAPGALRAAAPRASTPAEAGLILPAPAARPARAPATGRPPSSTAAPDGSPLRGLLIGLPLSALLWIAFWFGLRWLLR